MTVPLAAGSPRAAAAAAFGRELTRAMKKRGVGAHPLRDTGATGSINSINAWRHGTNLPRFETALRLAEALNWPKLAEIVRDARTVTCEICGGTFVYEGGLPARWCGAECREFAKQREKDGFGRLVPAVVEMHLGRARAAIHRMCWECEPEGACRTAECPLRRVSPLPLLEARDVDIARKPDGRWGRPGRGRGTRR